MYSKRRFETPITKKIPVIKQPINKEKIYLLFKNDAFLEKITLIIRDFLITTWKMQSESHIFRLRKKILIEPISKTILNQLGLEQTTAIDELTPIVVSILSPFFNVKNNNKLYEGIFYKWWSNNLQPFSIVNLSYTSTIYNITKKNLNHLIISNDNKIELLKQNMVAKLDFIAEATDKAISQDISRLFKDNSLFGFAKEVTKVFTAFLLLGLSAGLPYDILQLLIGAIILTMIFNFCCFQGYEHFGYIRKYGGEDIALTDYFITDILLDTLQDLLNKEVATEPVLVKYKPKKVVTMSPMPEIKQIEVTPISLNVVCEPKNELIKIKQALHKKSRDNKDKMMLTLSHRPDNQTITWQAKDTYQKDIQYLFNPLKIKSIVFALWAHDKYLMQACKNNFILCESATLKTLIKNKVQRKEFKSILRSGAVVKAQNCRGLVLIKDSFKAKTLKSGLSHYRLFCEPKHKISLIENDVETTKILHVPTKYCNK